MKITVTTLSDDIFSLEVSEDMELENFKALCSFETGIPSAEVAIVWNGRPLHDDKMKLNEYGVKDGEVLLLQRIQGARGQAPTRQQHPTGGVPFLGGQAIDFGSIQIPGTSSGRRNPGPSRNQAASTSQGAPMHPSNSMGALPDDPATLREMLLSSPSDLAILKERNLPLADALLSGSLDKFTEVLKKQQEERSSRERERIRMMNADPFDADAQKQIAEEIRLKNVEANMETAMEFAPESFGQVVMLYIDCMVNGHPVKAFVDSGAQMTIMSQACATRCGIMRLVDTRWAGIAKGVGTQKIIGRVHLCQMKIGDDYLQTSFSILEDQPMDMLLGLDMLKRHQCSIDLKRGYLVIGTTGTETAFLAEGDLPDHARLNNTGHDTPDEDRQLAEALHKSAEEAADPSQPHAGSSGTSHQQGAAASVPKPRFAESDIARLMGYGFSRETVLEELNRANGNVDQALAALFAKSFQVP